MQFHAFDQGDKQLALEQTGARRRRDGIKQKQQN